MAIIAEHGYRFGDELIWNYGPLGFLHAGPLLYYSDLATTAFLYQSVLQLLLAATLYVAARRSYPAPAAFVIAFVVLALVVDRALLLGFAWCVLAFTAGGGASSQGPGRLLARAFPVAIGVLAGVLVLSKVNQGVEMVAIAVTTLVSRPGRRPLDGVAFAAALLATAAVGWLATGQSLGDAWPYVRYAAETIGGYPAMAGAADPAGQLHYLVALLVFALGSVLVWNAARAAAPVTRWGFVAMWLIFSFASFKQGFIRHDEGHVRLYMTSMLTALAVLPVKPTMLWRALVGIGIVSCAVIGAGPQLSDRLDPYDNAKAAVEQVDILASGEQRALRRQALGEAIRGHYLLPPEIAAELGDGTVSFWPFAAGDLAFALGVDWRPLPVIEPYGISTPALDDVAAEMLASLRAPDRIVRRPRPVSDAGIVPARPPHKLLLGPPFEPPLTTRAIFCRYGELARSGSWQLLAHRSDRCGEPREVGSVVAAWGESVAVPRPRPGTAMLVQIEGSDFKATERLEALWLRPKPRMIVLDGRPYRLVPSTATSGHLIRAAADVDYPPPLNMAPNASTVAVYRVGDQPGGELRYRFLELPVPGRPQALP